MKNYLKLISLLFILVISVVFCNPTNAGNTVSTSHAAQGATITEKYFIYASWQGNNSITYIYRCNRSGTSISKCKKITSGVFGHANALDYNWGKNHFWIYSYDNSHAWCYNFNGKKVNKSLCGKSSKNNYKSLTKKRPGSVAQGYTQYLVGNDRYYIKLYYKPNSLQIFKNKNLVKTCKLSTNGEAEDVMVDGNTGNIYYTTFTGGTGGGKITLRKASNCNYKLPKASSSSSSSSSSGTSSKAPSKSESTKEYTFTPAESTYDGKVETTFFGTVQDSKGCGVYTTLNFVLDLLSVGVGIVAVIGISFVGVKYLTAHGDTDQTRRARKRIFQIIIGVAIYAVIYSLANWLLAGADFSGESCEEVTSSLNSSERNYVGPKMS